MNEFLRKLAQALGLDPESSEEQVIARVAQLAQGTPDVKELAQRNGMVALPTSQVAELTQQAQAGAAALEQVKTLRADLNQQSFEALVAQSNASPALLDTYKELWNQGHQDEVRKLLAAAPQIVRMTPTGRTVAIGGEGTGQTGATTLVQGQPLDRLGSYSVDDERLELHQRTESLAIAKFNGDYDKALSHLIDAGEAI